MKSTKVFLADAGSTDGTQELAMSFAGHLNIEVIPGGLPSVGRNAGARRASTSYVLFIDADMELKDTTLLRRAMELAERRKLHCVTTNIWCSQGSTRDRVLYFANNIAQYGSLLVKPFSTGMFMLFEKAAFERLGGFHEQALYAEDYLLSKKVQNRKFGIVSGCIHTTNRRFKHGASKNRKHVSQDYAELLERQLFLARSRILAAEGLESNLRMDNGSPSRPYSFPADFAWGIATSSHQVEGGTLNNQWAAKGLEYFRNRVRGYFLVRLRVISAYNLRITSLAL